MGAQEQAEASVSVLPVRIEGADGVAFEDSFQQGVKRESLRSLCRIVNATELPLEVALTKLQRATPEAGALAVRREPQEVGPLHQPCSTATESCCILIQC